MRIVAALSVAVVASAVALAAQEPGRWTEWPYVRPVAIDTAAETRLVSVPLPADVHRRANVRLNDLRLIDEQDREVPFLVHVPRGAHSRVWRPVRMLETSFLPGAYTQVILDTRAQGERHNAVELTIRETDFFAWVEVAASTDSSTWRILNDRLPLYRFAAEGHPGTQVLSHAPSTSRFLRLRLLNGDAALTVMGARVAEEVIEAPSRIEVPAVIVPAGPLPERHSGWEADFDGPPPPVSEAVFTAEEPEFHRPVRVRASDDGQRWRLAGEGEIYRLRRAGDTIEQLHVTFDESAARHLRVEVFNRNDPPLRGLTVAFRGVPRQVVFRQEPGRSYRLIYGFPRADMPAYELARLVMQDEIRAAVTGSLGAEAAMPGHPRPLPWTERHIVVLWLALGLAVAVVAWLAIRSLRTAAVPPNGGGS